MVNLSVITQYIDTGKNLILLNHNEKTPIYSNWRFRKLSKEDISSHNGNIGWVIGFDNLVIDVDIRNGGLESYQKLKEYIRGFDSYFKGQISVRTWSGGFHTYMKIPEIFKKRKFKKNLKEYPGIDFLTYGSYCLIPPSSINGKNYTFDDELIDDFIELSAPKCLIDKIIKNEYHGNSECSQEDDYKLLNLVGTSSYVDPDKLISWLNELSSDCDYNDWVKIGMALHSWDPIKGLELWEDWSKGSEKYQEGLTEKKWSSFSVEGGVTVGTINQMVKENNYEKNQRELDSVLEIICRSSEKEIQLNLIKEIRKLHLNPMNQEIVVRSIQNRLKELKGIRFSINEIRTMVFGKSTGSVEYSEEEETPDWAKSYYYANNLKAFINISNMRISKIEQFNLENGINVPFELKAKSKQSAFKYISDNGFVETVDNTAYFPTYDGIICKIEGSTYLNTFRRSSMPKPDEEYTPDGHEAIQAFLTHVRLIMGKENESVFVQWMAHQVQFPGKKILWAPLIQSIEGLGKSYFGDILSGCLGHINVGVVFPKQVNSNFNEWATNVCVNVLQELKISGHNRHEVSNSLKPLITDKIIQINDKGIRPYKTYNTCNYIAFTNYKNAIPIDENDRRWWIVYNDVSCLDDITKRTGIAYRIYFPTLFEMSFNNIGQIHKFLMDFNIDKEFMNTKQAPMTQSKMIMTIQEKVQNFEGYYEIEELIDTGSEFYNREIILSSFLFEDFENLYPDLLLSPRNKNNILRKMGYMLSPIRKCFKGVKSQIWSKHYLDTESLNFLDKFGISYFNDIDFLK